MKPMRHFHTRWLTAAGLAAGLGFGAVHQGLPGAAWAQFETAQTTQEGVEVIRQAMRRGLAQTADGLPDEWVMALDGDVDVAIQGSRYATEIPAISLRRNHDGDELDLSIGPIRATVEPVGGNRLATVIDPPDSLLGRQNGEPLMSIEWITRIAQGTFSADLGFAEALSIVLDDIALNKLEDGQTLMSVGNAALDVSYGKPSGDRVDGQGSFTLSEIVIEPGIKERLLTIAKTAVETRFRGFDVDRNQAYLDFSNRLGEWIEGDEFMPRHQAEAYADEIVGFLDIVDTFTQRTAITDLYVRDEEDEGGLSAGSISIGARGLAGEEAALSAAADIGMFDIEIDEEHAPFMPRRSQAELSLVELPMPLLREIVRDAAASLLSGEDGDEVARSLTDRHEAIMASGAALDIGSLIIELQESAIFANGRIDLEPTAAFGAVGKAAVRLVGLNKLTEQVRALPEGSEIAAFLAFLQAIGQLEEGAGGLEVRRYELELAAEGTLLLNGADIGPILEQMQ